MYTVYVVFGSIMFLSFITGSIILFVEHKPNLEIKNRILFDEEII